MIRIIDVETTALDGKVIELAMITVDEDLNIIEIQQDYINPEVEIDPSASCVHHITDEMVKDKPVFAEISKNYPITKDDIIIAHNSTFDIRMLFNESMTVVKECLSLDTLKLAKKVTDARYGNNKLGTLFYGYKCYQAFNFKGDAHQASYDCAMLLSVLKEMMKEANITTIEEAITLSKKKPDFGTTKCFFTKHKGKTWKEVKEEDPKYCEWIKNTFEKDSKNKDLLKYLNC